MKRWTLLGYGVAALLFAACGGPAETGEPAESTQDNASPAQTRQAMETDVEQWLAVGSSGRVDVVNPDDGEPDTVTARAVNRGAGVSYGVVGSEGWLVGSESGWVQLLDADGRDQGARRPVFAGSNNNPDPLNFLSYGEDGWLAGGTNGRVQLIDRDGQPFSSGTVNTQVAGTDITAAARGSSSWLVGSSQGDLIDVSEDSISNGNIVSTLGSGSPIVSIVYVGGIGADGSGRWVVMNASDAVKVSVSGATSAVTVAPDKDVATATVQGTTVVVGSTDGSVATYDATTDLSEFSWETVFPDGQGIRQLVQGQSGWLALGESGDMRLLDENASPTGSVETLPHGKTPTAARSLSGDGNAAWMVGLGDTSTVQKLDANLDPLYQNDSIFGSESIEAAAAGGGNIAVVGSGGSYRLLNPDGAPQGEIQSVDGVTQWNDVTWDGSQFVMAGTGGTVAELKTDGTIGRMASYLGEEDLVDIEYTGDFFGIFSENARYRRLRRNIDPFRAPVDVDMDTIEAAGFDGQSWAIVGSRNNKATYTIVAEDETVIEAPREVFDVDGSFFTVEWNGREWLMGGSGGNVVRVDAQGTLIEIDGTQQIRNVLYGLPVRDISFTGTEYLVGGDNGIIRRLQGSDSLPIRPGVVVNGFGQVSALQWSQARGFGGGPCLSSDVCLSGGECIGGGVQNGVCCESSCDDPCVACEESVTGEPTGNCANIPSGEEPPEDGEGDCPAMAESTCGTTGVCNGQGECAVYGDNVQCRGQTCEDGEITAPATCNSENMTCGDGMAMTTSCDPYAACADDTSCLTSCSDDDQCIDGYVCSNQACVDEDEAGNGNGNGNGGGNGGGCHSTSDDTPAGGFVLLLTALGALVWSRRSREGSPPEEAA